MNALQTGNTPVPTKGIENHAVLKEDNPLNTSFFGPKHTQKLSPDLATEKKVEEPVHKVIVTASEAGKARAWNAFKMEVGFGALWGSLLTYDLYNGLHGLACLAGTMLALTTLRAINFYKKSMG